MEKEYKIFGLYNLLDIKDYDIKELKYHNLTKDCDNRYRHYCDTKEAIDLINKMTNNDLDYLINLSNKYAEDIEKGIIKTNKYDVNMNSLKKWLRENDTRGKSSNVFPKKMWFLGDDYGLYSFQNIDKRLEKTVNTLYNRLINEIGRKEYSYFMGNDKKQRKISELKEYYSTLNFNYEEDNEFSNFGWSSCREISDDLLDKTLSIYREYDKKTKELKQEYSEKLQEVLDNYNNK